MHIALGCDHRGLELKQTIMGFLEEMGHDYHDLGCYNAEPVDYPDVAYEVAKAVASGRSDHGILICGSGIGMSIVANKVSGIRAALCCDVFSAQKARQHNDANVLCLSAGTAERGLALEIVKAYLLSTFEGGRHSRRIEKIHGIEASSLDNS